MRVHEVKRARKAIRSAGIKIGDSYFWWKFRFGPRCVSKTYPKPQQLTRSDFAISVYDLQDRISELDAATYVDDPSSLKSDLDEIASEIRALGEEQDEKLNNMPEGLQQGDTGQLLEERRDACDSWADEIESVEVDEPSIEEIEKEARAAQPNAAEDVIRAEIDEKYAEALAEAIESAIREAEEAQAP